MQRHKDCRALTKGDRKKSEGHRHYRGWQWRRRECSLYSSIWVSEAVPWVCLQKGLGPTASWSLCSWDGIVYKLHLRLEDTRIWRDIARIMSSLEIPVRFTDRTYMGSRLRSTLGALPQAGENSQLAWGWESTHCLKGNKKGIEHVSFYLSSHLIRRMVEEIELSQERKY